MWVQPRPLGHLFLKGVSSHSSAFNYWDLGLLAESNFGTRKIKAKRKYTPPSAPLASVSYFALTAIVLQSGPVKESLH